MKTKTNTRQACILTLVLWALVSGASVVAQSDPEDFYGNEVKEAFIRLDALMSAVEESARYVAPSDIYDDLRSAWERLDMLANRTENEIKYNATVVEHEMEFELANKKNELEAKENVLLSDIIKLSKIIQLL
jgi:hypothetical protein